MRFSHLALCAFAALGLAADPKQTVDSVGKVNPHPPTATTVDLIGQKHKDGKFEVKPAPEGQNTEGLQKRVAPVVAVIGIASIKGIAIITKIAIEIGGDTIKNLGEWNPVRRSFSPHHEDLKLTVPGP